MGIAREITLTSCTAQLLRALLTGSALSVLAGSGVSIWEPTSLPTGQQVTEGLFSALFQTSGMHHLKHSDMAWLEAWFREGDPGRRLPALPFEVVMACCTDHDRLRDILQGWYGSDAANPVHRTLAKMAAIGEIEAIMTTNYDCGLDTALKDHNQPLLPVLRVADVKAGSPNLYFKIHGSARAPDANTMVFSLDQEGALQPWKRDVLHRCVSGKRVLVLGYSGVDFDVCPEIVLARPREVFWNFHRKSGATNSPGLRRINEAGIPVTVLIGDMRELLGLLGYSTNAQRTSLHLSISDALRHSFLLDELLLWRGNILNKMGHARLALATLSEVSTLASSEHACLEAHAQTLFHQGRYVDSARAFETAAGVAGNLRAAVVSLLHACDAARCAGKIKWARRLLATGIAQIGSGSNITADVRGLAALKQILIEHDSCILSGAWFLRKGRMRLRRRLEPLFRQSARLALEHGQQFDFQQLELWRKRLGLPESVTHASGHYNPEDPSTGYRHLGYPVAVAMDLCDRALRGKVKVVELELMLRLMLDFGCSPQSWKLAVAILRKQKYLKPYQIRVLVGNFIRCQYAPKIRLAQLARVFLSSG